MAEQIFHIGVKALIRNEAGAIFLLNERRAETGEARWDIPGGRMDPNETFLNTLAREMQEELAVSYVGEPQFLQGVVSNLKITLPSGIEVALMLMAYEVTVSDPDDLRPVEQNAEAEWVLPRVAAERLARKYPPAFCELIASL